MNDYMLMFTLGPVQPFIMQARKTRDLWIGSFLLSKLMEAAMADIPGRFVFPGERKIKDDIPDLPNKYVALFDSLQEAEKAACQSELQIAACWYAICEDVRSQLLPGEYYSGKVPDIWERQITVHQLFEIYWVVVPDPGKGYGHWIEETTLLLDARKRLRNFLPQKEPGEKSTISGEREALHDKGFSRRDVRDFWIRLTNRERHTVKDIRKDGSERLDAIDSIKRFALLSDHLKPDRLKGSSEMIVYPSTSSVAAASFVKRLLSDQISDTDLANWKRVINTSPAFEQNPPVSPYLKAEQDPNVLPFLKQQAREREWLLRRDGDCFFPETFTPRYLKENYYLTMDQEEQQRERARGLLLTYVREENFISNCLKALEALYQAAKTPPTPYYALIQMDGDHMGTILSSVSSSTQHRNISKALSAFARDHVPEIVQETRPGRLVYAGGDDVLAFSPLDGMLPMLETLQQRYRDTISPVVPDESYQNVTASMGIAIGHHFTPLSVVRRAALEAEKLAKNRYGRNAFVVTLLRRSGEQTRVGCRWEYPFLTFLPTRLFDQFYTYFVKDVFSPKSVHVLLNEVAALVGLPIPAQRGEIRRVLKRQLNEPLNEQQLTCFIGKVDQLNEEQKAERITQKIASLAEQIVALAAAMDEQLEIRRARGERIALSMELQDDTLRYGLVETLGWLLVMAFLAREGREV